MKKSGKIFLAFFCLSLSFISYSYASGDDIAIYGDSQDNPEIQRSLVQTIMSFKPSVVFRVGDLVNNGNDPESWRAFNEIHGPLITTTEYFPALGNYERDPSLYFAQFPSINNQRWYSVDRLGIHFVILDSNSVLDIGSEQYRWLESDLAQAGDAVKFKVVIFHHPLFDVGRLRVSDEKKIRSILLPLFEMYGVSAVFSGHSHNYQRFEYSGIYFIVTGGGGSLMNEQKQGTHDDSYLDKFIVAYHFCLLTPEGRFLRVKVIDIDSNTIDEFEIPSAAPKYSAY